MFVISYSDQAHMIYSTVVGFCPNTMSSNTASDEVQLAQATEVRMNKTALFFSVLGITSKSGRGSLSGGMSRPEMPVVSQARTASSHSTATKDKDPSADLTSKKSLGDCLE